MRVGKLAEPPGKVGAPSLGMKVMCPLENVI